MAEEAEVRSDAPELTPAQLGAEAEAKQTVLDLFDHLLERMAHQAQHNAPLPPGMLAELRAIRAKL